MKKLVEVADCRGFSDRSITEVTNVFLQYSVPHEPGITVSNTTLRDLRLEVRERAVDDVLAKNSHLKLVGIMLDERKDRDPVNSSRRIEHCSVVVVYEDGTEVHVGHFIIIIILLSRDRVMKAKNYIFFLLQSHECKSSWAGSVRVVTPGSDHLQSGERLDVKYFQWMFNFIFKVKSKSWCSNLNIRSCVTWSSRDLIWISVKINTASLPNLSELFVLSLF